jgi:Na+/phosphate symporter
MLQLEFGPGHQVWQYLERGVQIVIGVSAISVITFLGEVWGSDNVPYEAVFVALWWLGYGFLIALLPTPLAWALVPVLGLPKDAEPRKRRILQGWAVVSLVAPLVITLWMFVYAAEHLIYQLAVAQGVDYTQIDLYNPDPDRDGNSGFSTPILGPGD